MSVKPDFVHLHLHTEFSLLDGACHVGELVGEAERLGMKAMAITDHGNMFGAVNFHDACRERGVKPILGCEIYVATGSRFSRQASSASEAYNHFTLLASSDVGYHNLVKLVSAGYLEGFYHRPRIDKDLLAKHSEGLIGLSGCLSSEISQHLLAGAEAAALESVGVFSEIFGKDRFYLEVMEHGIPDQRRVNQGILRIREKTGLKLAATNDAHYLHKDDHQAHDVLLCIGSGKKVHEAERLRFDGSEFYLKSPEEMAALFPDHPEALHSTVQIAEMCDFTLKGVDSLPAFDVPAGFTIESYFEKVTRDGFAERRRTLDPLAEAGRLRHTLRDYEERLEKEIGVIRRVGFSGYFLIVWDFMRYARDQGIPVGPGRGSAAGSLVAWCLRITDIDPIENDLIFERFLNEERISPPDIDIDFCEARRGEVIEYVTRKYGRDNVAQIITFGTMKAKAVVRDVGRVMDMSFAEVDKIAKMIPFDLKMTLERALEESPPLKEAYQKDAQVKELIDISKRLEGTTRHASTHAAGVVIAPEPLTDLVPLFKSNTGDVTTQFDMKGCERIGLLKMDFLGLRTLTLIDNCVKMVEAQLGIHIDPEKIPLDDAKTFELFTRGKTSGLFQFESDGMRDILQRFKPDRLEHLTALNALYRPGPMQMIDDFIRRRHGQKKVTYEHPSMEPILKETYGVMVYQEQVMKIASALAGFSLGEADILRKAMGKKKVEVMAAQMEKFLSGAAANGVPEKKARKVWSVMEQFAGYGFNKSHSAAYAWLAYQTAYLKANHPAYFMAALLTSERANTDKMVAYIGECREMGIRVLPPDVNQSEKFFTVVARVGDAGTVERLEGRGAGQRRRRPLRPGGHQERGRGRGGGHDRRPPGGRRLPVDLRLLRPGRPARGEPAGRREPDQERVLRFHRPAALGALRGDRPGDGGRAEAPAGPGAGTVEPVRDDGARGRVRAGHRPGARRPGVAGGRAAGLREGVAGLLHHRPPPRAVPRRARAVGRRHHRHPGGGRAEERGRGGRDRHRPAPAQDPQGRPHGDLRPRGPRGQRRDPGLPRDLQEDRRTPGRRPGGAGEGPGGGPRRRTRAPPGLRRPAPRAGQARGRALRDDPGPAMGWDRSKGERLRDILGSHRGDCPVTLEIVRPGAYAVALAPSALYRVRPGSGLREQVEELLGPGALVLSRNAVSRREA